MLNRNDDLLYVEREPSNVNAGLEKMSAVPQTSDDAELHFFVPIHNGYTGKQYSAEKVDEEELMRRLRA